MALWQYLATNIRPYGYTVAPPMIKTYATTGTHDRGKSDSSMVSGPKDNKGSRQLITNTSTQSQSQSQNMQTQARA